jgi:hypothetical protein
MRKQRIQQSDAEPTAHLTRYSSLNVRGVNPGSALDEDSCQPNSTQEKPFVRSTHYPGPQKERAGSQTSEAPRLRECDGDSTRDQRHRGVAERVHRHGGGEVHDVPTPTRYASELADVIKNEGLSFHDAGPKNGEACPIISRRGLLK